jgi:dolichol-phosphate mannosyltransferase
MHGGAGPRWSLSLVIPAYNEEAGIAMAITEADQALSQLAKDYEILVVDDGSNDRTLAVATQAAAHCAHVRLFHHERNRGYGAALRTGFEAARFDRVAFTDADCQFDLNELGRLVPLAEQAPIVAGFRVDRKDPWRRRFLSRGYNLLARALLGTRVRDCDCALKIFRRDALSHLLPQSCNFFVNTEMLTRARQKSYSVIEVGVSHRPRHAGRSKVSLSDVPKTLATLLPFWWSKVMFSGPALRSETGNALLPFLIVMFLAIPLFFSRLGTPLLEPEEARYAEIPRQMLAEGQWLVPTLHGQPYLDKPPLLYWLVMASYSLFGVHDWAARLVPGFAGLLTVAVSYWWASRAVGIRAALLGAAVLCLTAKFIYLGRMVTMNAPLALLVTSALALGHLALMSSGAGRQRVFLAMAGIACGLGLLTKGPVATALIVPPLLVIARLDPRLNRPGLLRSAVFPLCALLVAAPWYVAVALRQPEFLRYFFWLHNVVRFAQPFDHQGPIWQYIPGLLIGIMPWTLLLYPMLRFLTRLSARKARRRPAALGMFLLSFASMFLFFSLAGSKRPVYLVPVFPPLALAIGCYLDATLPHARLAGIWSVLARYRTRFAFGLTAVALTLGLGLGITMFIMGAHKPERALYLTGGSALSLLAFLALFSQRRATWLLAGSATFAVLLAGIHELLPEYSRRFSLRHPVRMHLVQTNTTRAEVLCYPHFWESVSYYTERSDVHVFTRNQRDDLIDLLDARQQTLLCVQTKYLPEILHDLPPSLEFISKGSNGEVTVGEVRRQREAVPPLAQRADLFE